MKPKNQGRLAFMEGNFWYSDTHNQEVRIFEGKLLSELGIALSELNTDDAVEHVWDEYIDWLRNTINRMDNEQ